MRAISKLKTRGFTLIELMIVVAIVGVLAALAIYGVRRYLLNAKTAEARNSVGQLAKDAKTAYERESMSSATLAVGGTAGASNQLCAGITTSIPSAVTLVQGQKYQSSPTEWKQGDAKSGFQCVKFSMSDPQYYMYSYLNSSTSNFTARANGDLDGVGGTSQFDLYGTATSGIVLISPNFAETDPEE